MNTIWPLAAAPGLVEVVEVPEEVFFSRSISAGRGPAGGGDLGVLSAVGDTGLLSGRDSLSTAGDVTDDKDVEEVLLPGRLRGGLGGKGGGTLGEVGELTRPLTADD